MRGNTNFINALKQPVKVVDAELVIDDDINLSGEDINSVRFEYESELFTAVMTKLTIVVKLINATASDLFAKKGKTITDCTLKASYLDGWATMSITDKYGEYVIKDVTIDGKENTATLVCYDRMIDTMKPFELDSSFCPNPLDDFNMHTLLGYIAGKLGWYYLNPYADNLDPLNSTHNMLKGHFKRDILEKMYFAEDGTALATYRDVLNDIAPVIASNIVIDVYYGGDTPQPWLQLIPVGEKDSESRIEQEDIFYPNNKLTAFDYTSVHSYIYKVEIASSESGTLATYTGQPIPFVSAGNRATYKIVDNPFLTNLYKEGALEYKNWDECKTQLGDALTASNWTWGLVTYSYNSFGYGYFPECGMKIKIRDVNGTAHACLVQNYSFIYDNGITESGSAETVLESDDNTFSYASITEQNTSNIEKLSNDSGWFDVDFESEFEHYTNQKLQYRKIGNVVELRGAAKAINAITLSGVEDYHTIGTMDYAPTNSIVTLCHGSGLAIWRCIIYPTGEIKLSRYRDNSGLINVPANAWLPIHITFLLG